MNVTDYTYLLNKPDAITEKQADALGAILNEFPYFQSARALRLKGLYNQNSFKYNYALKITAAHTTDRTVLFDFITSETFTAIQNKYYEQKFNIIPPVNEEVNIDSPSNTTTQSTVNSIIENTSVAYVEEPVKATEIIETAAITPEIPEVRIDPIEQSILNSIKEASRIVFERPAEVINEAETPAITPEIPEVRIDPIEQSILNSIKEASTVQFEEVVASTPDEPEASNTTQEETIAPVINEVPVPLEEPVQTAESNLEIGKPLDFSDKEKHSFQEWLQLARNEPIDRTTEPVLDNTENTAILNQKENEVVLDEKKKKAEIIDKFIETNPKISPVKSGSTPLSVPFELNKDENTYLMTETLARVYLEQKKYTKAIQAYEILILKYPEKITFFADRISDIKILQQNNNNN